MSSRLTDKRRSPLHLLILNFHSTRLGMTATDNDPARPAETNDGSSPADPPYDIQKCACHICDCQHAAYISSRICADVGHALT